MESTLGRPEEVGQIHWLLPLPSLLVFCSPFKSTCIRRCYACCIIWLSGLYIRALDSFFRRSQRTCLFWIYHGTIIRSYSNPSGCFNSQGLFFSGFALSRYLRYILTSGLVWSKGQIIPVIYM